jgi:long-subunit acyl-CoA synthetase (AMP-forming)
VAPAPIENRLNAHPIIEQSMVSGMGHPQPYAMVVLAEDLRPRVADPAVREQVQQELSKLREDVNRELAPHERLAMIVVAHRPWSIEDGLLTPTMKIRRSSIEAAVAGQVDGWYSAGQTVQWA